MADETLSQRPKDDRAEAATLRQALGEMRREAEQEVARINLRLRERESAAEGGAESAAERLALRQELESLQRVLSAKEQALDNITQECRRLEDVLEDQHVIFDGLRKEVERRDVSLKVAQEEVERLRQSLAEIQAQSLENAAPGAHPPESPGNPPRTLSRWTPIHLWSLLTLLALGLLAAVVWSRLEISAPIGPGSTATPAETGMPEAGPEPPSVVEAPASEPVTTVPVAPPPTQRDRLRSGAFGPTLVMLQGGRFQMGHNLTIANDFGPAHEVSIEPFLMGAYEVTFDQFDRFVRSTGRDSPPDFGWGRGSRPVVGVSWDDARAYASWLSRETGRSYRLPTEAEWEYGARAGGRGSYWWGFGLEPGRAVCFDCGSAWDRRSTAPVGSFEPSPFGLFDTAGNVTEWVADCYHASYRDAPGDGRARLDGNCTHRVARGGGFNKPASSMRAYVRERFVPETRLNVLGFRIARDP
ncbi:MAG: SUMF1/EgtB/PvdO family nonheme iron enzyme [Thiocapsa sp.]|nr:SUMF1/EgtB/PvdO family nonheme iron enzyme [Thiocapsa sp.]MCG6895855.1 SUMF1/EgtB/PvdO family nonheme iron enzyme [Thiocapsa sp.]MCG6984917.1 SUMF1/EgtB/PvdO family nonheme iron enzyme [Thiocapsa sp.]